MLSTKEGGREKKMPGKGEEGEENGGDHGLFGNIFGRPLSASYVPPSSLLCTFFCEVHACIVMCVCVHIHVCVVVLN